MIITDLTESAGPVKHRIALTVTDPNHPMVSKRGETLQRTVRVPGADREKAINAAIAHYRRRGYRVHDHHYIGTVDPIDEGWKEETAEHDEFLAHARQQLQAASPTERNALAQRLSKLEQKHFPELFSGGGQVSGDQYDTETGQSVIGPSGISSNIAGIIHTLTRPQKPQGPNIQNLPFGTVANHDVWNHYANNPDNQGIRPSYAMPPEYDPEEARRTEELRQQQNAAAFAPDEMDEFYDSLPQRVKDLKKVAKDPASAARFEELFNDQSGMDWHINDIIGYYEYMIKNGPMDPAGYEDARMTDAGLEEGFDPIRPLDLKHWAQKVKMYYPDAQFIRAKMPGGPSIAKSGGVQVGSFEPSKGTSKIIRPQGVSSISAGSTMEEGKPQEKEADYGADYQAMVQRVKKLAGIGPMKTVHDPAKRVYRNVPTAVQPKRS